MYLEAAREEVTQRVAHLLDRAMNEKKWRVPDLAKAVHGSTNAVANKQIQRILTGDTLPRLDTLSELLAACGFDLVLSMRPSVEVDDDD